jgi:hypothetical protein
LATLNSVSASLAPVPARVISEAVSPMISAMIDSDREELHLHFEDAAGKN